MPDGANWNAIGQPAQPDVDLEDPTPVYEDAGRQYHVDPDLLRAQDWVESHNNDYAVSPAGAQGRAQFIPSTARLVGLKDPWDWHESIPAQAKLLRANMDQGGNPLLAVGAYHNGSTDERKWGAKTYEYLDAVAEAYKRLKARQQKPPAAPSWDDIGKPASAPQDWDAIGKPVEEGQPLTSKQAIKQLPMAQVGAGEPGGDPRLGTELGNPIAPGSVDPTTGLYIPGSANDPGAQRSLAAPPPLAVPAPMPPMQQGEGAVLSAALSSPGALNADNPQGAATPVPETPIGRGLGAIGEAMQQGYENTPDLLAPMAQKWADEHGLGGDARALGVVLGAFNAAWAGAMETANQTGIALGQPQLGRDAAAMIEAAGMTGYHGVHMPRDQPIPSLGKITMTGLKDEPTEGQRGLAFEGAERPGERPAAAETAQPRQTATNSDTTPAATEIPEVVVPAKRMTPEQAANEEMAPPPWQKPGLTELERAGPPAPPWQKPGMRDVTPEPVVTPEVTPTTPEPPSDISAQVAALVDRKNPKDAVFVAAGNESAIPDKLPKRIEVVRRPEGVLLTDNKDKAAAFRDAEKLDDASLAQLLGYPETKQEAVASGNPAVVQGTDPVGNVVAETLASPEGVPAAEAAVAAQAPDVHVTTPEDAQARRTAGTTPPQPPGTVRFYHGGADYDGGSRWLTQDRKYAQDHANKIGSRLFYVDVPENSPLLHKTYDDSGTGQTAPYAHFDAPPEIAAALRPVEWSPSAPLAKPPTPQVEPPWGYVLPSFVTDPHRRPQEKGATKPAPGAVGRENTGADNFGAAADTTQSPEVAGPPTPPAEPQPETAKPPITVHDEADFASALQHSFPNAAVPTRDPRTGALRGDKDALDFLAGWDLAAADRPRDLAHTGPMQTGHDAYGWWHEPPPAKQQAPGAEERQAPPPEPPPRPSDYGAKNKFVTPDEAASIRARLRAKAAQLRSGVDPQDLIDGARLALFHIEAGARKFSDYARETLADIGDEWRPYLRSWYESVRHWPEFDATGMSSDAEIAADLHRLEGEKPGGQTSDTERMGEPGGGEAESGGVEPGQPEGNRHPEEVAPGAAEDVREPGESAAEVGVRTGRPEIPVEGAVPEGGAATTGRGRAGDEGVAASGAGEPPPAPASIRQNFHVTDPDHLIGGTPKVRFARNRAAIEALRAVEEEQRAPTQEELQTMAGYTGWGSFGQDLFQGSFENQFQRKGWDNEAKWLRDYLGKDAWEDAQRSIINAHYTDPPTVQAVWDIVKQMGFNGGRVLEPSMGVGNFFGMMPRDLMANSRLTGIEWDRTTAAMAKLLYPDAGVHNKPYQDSRTPDNFYDLAIGNWPFSNKSPADRRYDRLGPSLHDYFFLKALDQTRPGGLVAGITASGTMDKVSRSTRMELAKKGELVAAFRLPAGAFEQYAGTHAVTDLLVFRKRETPLQSPGEEPWINTSPYKTEAGPEIRVNDYWKAHPENVLGKLGFGRSTIGQPGMTVERAPNYPELLSGLAARVPEGVYQPPRRGGEPRFITNNTTDRQGSVVIGDDGNLYQVQGERLANMEDLAKGLQGKAKATRITQLKSLVGMRKAYGALIDAERSGSPETETLRGALREQFDAFRGAHGNLADSPALKVLDRVKDPSYNALIALEQPDGTPSRILSEPTIRSTRSIDNPSIPDAYVMARNKSKILDLDHVAELAKVPREEAEKHLLDAGAIYRTPGGGFDPSDVYLSGNVRRKLREAQEAQASGEDMAPSIEALEKVMPATVPYYQIEAKLGAPWVGDETYKKFAAHLLGLPEDERLDGGINIRFAGGRWRVGIEPTHRNRMEARSGTYGTPFYPFHRLLEAAMSNRTIKIRSRDADGNLVFDPERTEEANNKAAAIREHFTDWLWSNAERKMEAEGAYNETMNAIAKPRYDGSFLDMSGMALHRGDDPFSLRKHQVNAIWRGVQLGRGLFAHEVGTGKTYTMGGIAVEGRRYGAFRKPLVFAHNANSEAVYREMQQMYPGGKFLYIDNLSPKEIGPQLHRVANDDWDAVVMPHSLIDRMTLTRKTLMDLAQDQIANLENEAMEAARDDGVRLTPEMMGDADAMKAVRSVTAKNLVKQRQSIIDNIEKQANRSSREDAIPFENLGVDALMVDEAHEFKKPPLVTKMQMRGLNTQPSARSIALNFLTGHVTSQNEGRGVYLFTGTPVTNTLNEIFNMARYFMGDRMEKDGIKDWDTWFNTFADATSDVELTAAGTYEPTTRLASFVNTDELVRMMSEFTDVVRAQDMPEFVKRPTAEGRSENPIGRPYKKIENDVAEMTPTQRAILSELQERAAQFKNASKKQRRDWMLSGDRRNPVIVETDAANASLDARLYDPRAPDDPNNKVNRVANNVLRIYGEPNAAQVVFVDRGYAGSKASPRFVLVKDLVNKLVAGGIPRKEIEIVAGGVSPERKSEIAAGMNNGTIRVVIGQSSTLGVGVNMQRNLRAMHHMDAPWRPGDLEQRNGRGERQGNEWNTVQEHRYITEGIDGRRWQVLAAKDRFIKQFIGAFRNDTGKRIGSIEGDVADISDDESIMNTLSSAAGDPRLMIREKFRNDINRLERRERAHAIGAAEATQQARAMRGMLEEQKVSQAIEASRQQVWDEAEARAEAAAKEAGAKRRWYEAEVEGRPVHDQEEINAALDEAARGLAKGERRNIMTINGHRLEADWTRDNPMFRLSGPDDAFINWVDPTMASIMGSIRSQRARVEDAKKPSNFEKRIQLLEDQGRAPFMQQERLAKRREQVAKLDADLQANPIPPPGWLRHGAPVDTHVYVDGEPRVVIGHGAEDGDWVVRTEDGDVPYLQARNEAGQPIFYEHAGPAGDRPRAAEPARGFGVQMHQGRPALEAEYPGQEVSQTLYSFPGALFDPAAWRRAFGALKRETAKPEFEVLRDKKGIARAAAEIRAGFAPTAMRGAKPMEYALRRHNAESAQAYDQSFHELEKVRRATDELSKQAQVEFTDRMERGEAQPTPELQAVADALREQLGKWAVKIQGLGKGYLANTIEDYMGHIWGNYAEWKAGRTTDLTQAEMEQAARAAGQARRPLVGSQNYLKRRVFPTQLEGLEAGLVPVTYNPVDLQLIKLHEMQKSYHGHVLADRMKEEHLATWVPANAAAEREAGLMGWRKLDDSIFQPRLVGESNEAGFGRLEPGNYWAPESIARVFNNYMSQGWHGRLSIYDGVRRANNALNTLQLGFSGFHAAFVTADTAISKVALGLQQVVGGRPLRGAGNIAHGMTILPAVVQTVRRGSKVRQAWLDPENATPEMRAIIEALKAGGGRMSMPKFFQTSASGAFFHSLTDLKNPASMFHQIAQMFRDEPSALRKAGMVPFRIAFRVLDTIQEPLMGALVPRAKLGVFADMAENWMRDHPDATPLQVSEAMTKFQDSVDNRLGQLNYDNLFWDKTAKDIAFVTTRSVGWNLGTLREIGGGGVDTIALGKNREFTTRMAYLIAMPIITAEIGAILTFLATGQGPQSLMDYFYPPVGEPDENGRVERRSIPGYMKDVVAVWHDWKQTLLNKMAPLPETAHEIWNNRDYYGGIIYDQERDNSRAEAYGDFLLNQAAPFTLRSYNRLEDKGASALDQALSFWGFQPAPASITQPERGERFHQREDTKAYKQRMKEPARMEPSTWIRRQLGLPSAPPRS